MAIDEELWQAYDEQGEAIAGQSITKLQARQGALHGTAHLWIWRTQGKNREILLQTRAHNKRTWPDHFDISAAGHIDFGETPLQAVIRETSEELGLAINPQQLRLLFVYRQLLQDASSGTIENEFQWVYCLRLERELKIALHDGEVDAVAWTTLPAMRALISRQTLPKILPHGEVYFTNLFRGLDRENHSH